MNKGIIMNTLFKALPLATQTEVKTTLSAYDRCTVEKTSQGTYKVMTTTVLHCGDYNKVVAEFTKDGIFTAEQQQVNYMNTFRDFPLTGYNGVKDWKALAGDWKTATLVGGDFVFH